MALPSEVRPRQFGVSLDRPNGSTRPRRAVEIAPAEGWPAIDFAELWAYRGLLLLLVWRDVKSRYSQTVLGAGWAVLQPVLPMVIFSIVFGRFARIPSDGVPYPLFCLAGLVPWTYFASALSGGGGSLILNRNLLTKVYFPRLVIPGAQVLAALVDFAIATVVLLLALLAAGIVPGIGGMLFLPILVVTVSMTAMGAGSWLAALSVQYRDVRHLSPFLVQIWMYASPIAYPMSLVPEAYRPFYALNPRAGLSTAFRALLLGTPGPTPLELGLSMTGALAIFLAGTVYFRHAERVFPDVA